MQFSWNSVLIFPFFEYLKCTTGNLQQNPASLTQNRRENTSKDISVPAPHRGWHLHYVLSNLNFVYLAGLTPGWHPRMRNGGFGGFPGARAGRGTWLVLRQSPSPDR